MAYVAAQRSRIMMGAYPIIISYPGQLNPRWSESISGHPRLAKVIDDNRGEYERLIKTFGQFRSAIESIPDGPSADSTDPSWTNSFFTGIDAVSLYGILASQRPKRYFEIGSGNSTKLARRAIRDQRLATVLLSIDPSPQAKIDELCDTVIRQRLEDTQLEIFDQLEAGDVLFFDGSHHAFMSSDVVVFWLEILPRLRPGVLVHIHDIFLPYDYPANWNDRYYSEQYLLAVALLARQRSLDVIFPAHFVEKDPALSRLTIDQCGPRAQGSSGSFWVRTKGTT
jgi:predicted O-methyltransferase YrrM